jgi:hypothetical protein
VGEAHFYRPWFPGAPGGKRAMNLRHLSSQNASGVAIVLNSSQSPAGGYLMDDRMDLARLPRLGAQQQTDVMQFSLDGFSLSAATGIVVDGIADIRNGVTRGCFHGVRVSGECQRAMFTQVHLLDSLGVGFRADLAPELFPGRKKSLTILDSRICGSRGSGITLDWVRDAQVRNCQIRYDTGLDGRREFTQASGVVVAHDAQNVVCEGNLVTTSGGAAYTIHGAGPRGCRIEAARGTVSTLGKWSGEKT